MRKWISFRIDVDFVHIMYIKQMPVFSFIFDLLWTGDGFSVSSVPSLGFREQK